MAKWFIVRRHSPTSTFMSTTLRVFVSSPSDVTTERARVSRVVDRLRRDFPDEYEFEVIRYEEGVYFANEGGFQDQIVSSGVCDLVICILWSRLGTPLPDRYKRQDGTHPTGTEYQFETAMDAASRQQQPAVLVYLKTTPPARDGVDQQRTAPNEADLQFEMLKAFWFKWMRDERGHYTGSYNKFENADDFERKLEQHARTWLTDRRSSGASWKDGSPYRGLEVFKEEHERVFFGRSRAVAEIRARLTATTQQPGRVPFLLVLGPSGSGKSSVVRAGLVPELTTRNRVPGVDAWRRCIVRPSESGPEPLLALATAIFDALPEMQDGDYSQPEEVARHVWSALPAEAPRPVVGALDRWARRAATEDRPPVTNLLIVIDQLEELFRWDPSAQSEFIRLVGSLARSGRIWVVATFRNDFYPQLAANLELRRLTDAGAQYDLPPLGQIEFSEIVRRPAQAAGLSFEIAEDGRRLDDIILDDVKTQPDSLPLVEFALEQLYLKRNLEKRELTFAAYNAMHGLAGSIASRAESLLQDLQASGSLGVADAALIGRIFNRLATVSENGRLTSSSTVLEEFDKDPAESALITAFERARLLVVDQRTFAAGEHIPIVRVAHDALLHNWPRVAEWAKSNARFLLWRARLTPVLETWKRLAAEGNASSSALLRGDLLAEAERWSREMTELLTHDEAQFIGSIVRRKEFARSKPSASRSRHCRKRIVG